MDTGPVVFSAKGVAPNFLRGEALGKPRDVYGASLFAPLE